MNSHYIQTEQFLELSSELAELLVIETWPESPYQTEQNGDLRFTPDAQDSFNSFLDNVTSVLNRNGIHAE